MYGSVPTYDADERQVVQLPLHISRELPVPVPVYPTFSLHVANTPNHGIWPPLTPHGIKVGDYCLFFRFIIALLLLLKLKSNVVGIPTHYLIERNRVVLLYLWECSVLQSIYVSPESRRAPTDTPRTPCDPSPQVAKVYIYTRDTRTGLKSTNSVTFRILEMIDPQMYGSVV